MTDTSVGCPRSLVVMARRMAGGPAVTADLPFLPMTGAVDGGEPCLVNPGLPALAS